MATREQLHREVDALDDEQVERAEIVVAPEAAEGEQPPLTCIGMINSGRGDLSARASRDEFEPEPFR